MAYLDTSVLAAYYCPEQLSDAVGRVLGDITTPTISPLVEIELCSALSLKVRTRELDVSSARVIISRFQADITSSLYELIDVGPREFQLGAKLVEQFFLAVADTRCTAFSRRILQRSGTDYRG